MTVSCETQGHLWGPDERCVMCKSSKPQSSDELRLFGVSRMSDNDRALLVSFNRTPTDDELRRIHDLLRAERCEHCECPELHEQDEIRSTCMDCGRYNGEHAPECPRASQLTVAEVFQPLPLDEAKLMSEFLPERGPMSVERAVLADKISRLPDWPNVELGNYPSWDGGYNSALRAALSARVDLMVEWMEGRMPCAIGECCHELRDIIAACKQPTFCR